MAHRAELIVDAQNATGESPVWIAAEQALYWVDIPNRQLLRWQIADAKLSRWSFDQMIACIARCEGDANRWFAGMQDGIYEIELHEDGRSNVTLRAGVQHRQDGMRFNDGRCDRQGRFWGGTMVLDMAAGIPAGELYRLDGASIGQPLATRISDLIVPNGLGFSPDGDIMYLSDSHPSVQRIWAFDYDVHSGTPSNRRLFVDMNAYPGRPDGAAVDADGCYWICGNDAGLIHRFTPDGRLDRSLEVPVKKPAMCAFGGAGLDTLFVTSIRPGGDLSDQPLAGGVFALQPGVTGLEETRFHR